MGTPRAYKTWCQVRKRKPCRRCTPLVRIRKRRLLCLGGSSNFTHARHREYAPRTGDMSSGRMKRLADVVLIRCSCRITCGAIDKLRRKHDRNGEGRHNVHGTYADPCCILTGLTMRDILRRQKNKQATAIWTAGDQHGLVVRPLRAYASAASCTHVHRDADPIPLHAIRL